MKKNTEKISLSIPVGDENNVRRVLQEVCDEYGIYPHSVKIGKKGTIAIFVRNLSVPPYKYTDTMQKMVNNMKLRLSILTILMVKTTVMVNTENMPSIVTDIKGAKTSDGYNSQESQVFKNLEEDEGYFYSHTIKQMEEADYDTKEGREAASRTVRAMRYMKRLPVICEEKPTYAKNGRQTSMEGQIKFNF